MAKNNVQSLAVNGGEPQFKKIIPVGQINFPEWERFEEKFKGIFDRRFYTNHGPLLTELEEKLQKFMGVKHAICMTNATIALMIAAKALDLKGKVITPGFSFIATAQSLSWAGLSPVFCDVDIKTHHITIENVEKLITKDVSAILSVNLWGGSCDVSGLQKLANDKGIKIYFDSAQGFGCTRGNTDLANIGELSVFSFHATKILNAAEGGCVCTNDDDLAEKLRNIRSSYGVRKTVEIPFTGNGRMSEAQAAMALLSLEDYPKNQRRNKEFYDLYKNLLRDVPGLHIYEPDMNGTSNYQYVVCELDEKGFGIHRNRLVEILKAENILSRRYFTPGIHRSVPYCDKYPEFLDALPNTDILCKKLFQLPSGQDVTLDIIENICDIIKLVQQNSKTLS